MHFPELFREKAPLKTLVQLSTGRAVTPPRFRRMTCNMANERSLITADVDFERDGIQTGALRVPYSHDRDPYGYIPIPLMVARGGAGPTILLTGANHGDEYEGSIALMHLMREISTDRLNGRLIIIPGLNFPAFLNGTRTSPIDKGNLNRVFPGKRNGTPTEMIAHYVESELMPRADYAPRLPRRGATMNYLPMLYRRADVGTRPMLRDGMSL